MSATIQTPPGEFVPSDEDIVLSRSQAKKEAKQQKKKSGEDDDFSILDAGKLMVRSVAVVVAAAIILGMGGSFLGFWRVETVLTGSMRPQYPEGSMVVALKQPSTMLGVGQVIMFVSPEEYGGATVTHRIRSVELGDDGRPLITTKGDNNPVEDPWKASVTTTDTWVVRAGIPLMGWVSVWMQKWMFAVIGGAISLMIVQSVLSRRREQIDENKAALAEAESEGSPPEKDHDVDPETADDDDAKAKDEGGSPNKVLPLLIVAALVMGAGIAYSVTGAGYAITAEAKSFKKEQNPDQAAPIIKTGEAEEEDAPTATPEESAAPAAPTDLATETSTAPSGNIMLDDSGKNEAPSNSTSVKLDLAGGQVDTLPVAVTDATPGAEVLTVIDLINGGSNTLGNITLGAEFGSDSALNGALTLQVESCGAGWTLVRSKYVCPGGSVSVLGESRVSGEPVKLDLQMTPQQATSLLASLRVVPDEGASVAGTQTDLTFRILGG